MSTRNDVTGAAVRRPIRNRAFQLAAHLAHRYPALPNDLQAKVRQTIAAWESSARSTDMTGLPQEPRHMDLLQVARELAVLYGQLSDSDRKLLEMNLRGVVALEKRQAARARPQVPKGRSKSPTSAHNAPGERQRPARNSDKPKSVQTPSKSPRIRKLRSDHDGAQEWSLGRCPHCRHVVSPAIRHVCPHKERPFDQRSNSVLAVPGGGPGTGRRR